MNKAPSTYAEYSELLLELQTASNRREIIGLLYQGSIDWQSGIAERLTRLIFDTTNVLIERMNKAFTQDTKNMAYGPDVLGTCLVNARRWFADMFSLATLPVLSAETSQNIQTQIQSVADKMQQELERLARHDDPGGSLLHQIRQNPVNKNYQISKTENCGGDIPNPQATTKRKIIIL